MSSALAAGLLHELFERQAEVRPGDSALVCAGARISYGELDRRANQLARYLRSRGISRGDCVALLLPRSADVYVTLLAILKAGAAYVPLDPEYPAERVAFILADCAARALITTKALAEKAAPFHGLVLALDEIQADIASFPPEKLSPADTGVTPEDLCYIIYTSGTTGRPKGVQIEHRSVCHLVRAEGEIFQVRPEDRVFQGFSMAFDASVEEVWLAFYAGATLVVGTSEMLHAGAALSPMLAETGVTVLSCVPTLLAMMETDVPSMRLLILGGEACPPNLVQRWWKPGRRVVNTYGPTEATVIATFAECHPDRPVTIGRPLPGYSACIVDELLQPVVDGVSGELCLGGIGLARGYVGRPDLTASKFVSFATNGVPPQRFYRTGDLARRTPNGEIEFLGRLDSQVKIRGFRVELSEIEAVLLESPEVKAAAVALREDTPGLQQLVAYIVPRTAAVAAPETLRASLRTRLPAYMVPALIETLPGLPTLPSGKVDRKRLPVPQAPPAEIARELLPPRTALEQQVAAVWNKLFAPRPVSLQDDFFLELGGHSLLAARMVSELRKAPPLAQLSMADVYRFPTIQALAAEFEQRNAKPEPSAGVRPSSGPFWRHFFCGSAQLVSLFFVLSFFALQWLTPYLTYTVLIEEEYDFLPAVLGAFASLILFYPIMLAIPIAVKWLVIGRYKPGAYPLWGAYYFRWWLVTTIEAAVPVGYLTGTPLLNLYLRLMGAKIGRNVHLDSDSFAIYDLLSVGDDSSINVDSNLLGYTVEDGLLKLGRITIGNRCFIGARSALREDTVMEDDSALEDLSLLPRGATIPSGQTWLGSPASSVSRHCPHPGRRLCPQDQPQRPRTGVGLERVPRLLRWFRLLRVGLRPYPHSGGGVGMRSPASPVSPQPTAPLVRALSDAEAKRRPCSSLSSSGEEGRGEEAPSSACPDATQGSVQWSTAPATPAPSAGRRFWFGLLHGLGLLVFPVLVVAALFPGIVVMNKLNYLDPYYWYLLLAPLVGLSFIVLLCLEIAAIKWLLLGKVKPGRHPIHSFYYLRKWFVDQTMDLSLDVLGPLYASVYLTPWYKLLGAKLGKGAEVSTASFISPDLLSIGEESFIADSVSLGAPRVRDGFVTIGKNHIGKRSFVGNSAMLPPGTVLGDQVLIGCLSAPPANPADAQREDSTWMGSPSIFLPQRQKSAGFSEETTFTPSANLRAQRATIEFVRVITPSTCFIILLSLLFSALLLLHDYFSLFQTLLFFPFLYIGCGLAAALLTIAAKWLLLWRYRPGEKPLWNHFVWRNELLNALHEHLAEPFLVGALTGTPFICWYFRLLGARIGRRVYMETTDFSEFDLARIGDEAALNADCTIQTHLFEDRVMKMSTVDIGPRCKVGAGSLVLYDTRMEPGSSLGDLSLLMKGEVLPAGTNWQGIPARAAAKK